MVHIMHIIRNELFVYHFFSPHVYVDWLSRLRIGELNLTMAQISHTCEWEREKEKKTPHKTNNKSKTDVLILG